MSPEIEILAITSPEDEELLDAFHRGIYWDAFARQHEPVAVWKRALWGGDTRYELAIRIAGSALRDPARRQIVAGIAFERYPRSGCGLITYLVVAPAGRRQGLGRQLQRGAAVQLLDAGAPFVLGEVNDPRRPCDDEPLDQTWRRLERNQAWGGRVLALRYIQPALAPGLARDHGLCLIAVGGGRPLPATLPGAIVRDFIDELYLITEGAPPDPALIAAIPDTVALVELHR